MLSPGWLGNFLVFWTFNNPGKKAFKIKFTFANLWLAREIILIFWLLEFHQKNTLLTKKNLQVLSPGWLRNFWYFINCFNSCKRLYFYIKSAGFPARACPVNFQWCVYITNHRQYCFDCYSSMKHCNLDSSGRQDFSSWHYHIVNDVFHHATCHVRQAKTVAKW